MKQRCNNPNDSRYACYGGSGITYTATWEIYKGFLADMGIRPENKTLDRINPYGNYTKENCRWATTLEQAENKRLPGSRKTSTNNGSGLNGVYWHTRDHLWHAQGQYSGKRIHLYRGFDFFEACCQRKSWEASLDNQRVNP